MRRARRSRARQRARRLWTTAQLSGTTSAGTLCVQVYDIGNQTAPVSYTVTVTHP